MSSQLKRAGHCILVHSIKHGDLYNSVKWTDVSPFVFADIFVQTIYFRVALSKSSAVRSSIGAEWYIHLHLKFLLGFFFFPFSFLLPRLKMSTLDWPYLDSVFQGCLFTRFKMRFSLSGCPKVPSVCISNTFASHTHTLLLLHRWLSIAWDGRFFLGRVIYILRHVVFTIVK